jgi:multiple sugar transport system substrate-binding protein
MDSDTNTGASGGRLSRRHYLTAVGAVGASALAGCTGGGGSGGDGGSSGGDGSDGGGGSGGDGSGNGESTGSSGSGMADSIAIAAVEGSGRLVQRLMNNYVSEETGIDVQVSLFPYANLFEKTSSVLQTEGDAYDIVYMDDPWFPQLATYVDPIQQWLPSDLPTDQFIDTTLDIATWPAPRGPTVPSAQGLDQKLRGVVFVGNTQLFAYNQALYEEVGASTPPETWDDVASAGRKVSEQVDGAHGYIIRGKRGNPINANFYGLGNSRAGDMFTDEWRYRWDESAGVDTLDFFVNDLKSISPEGVASFDSDRVLQGLGDGSVAQAPAWPSAASLLLDPEQADAADDIAFTPIPKGQRRAPQQGNWIAGINSFVSDDKKKAAGEVIRSFVSKEAQQRYVELGGVPFRHDTFEENMDAQPWFSALYESLQTAKWRPRTPLWNRIAVEHGRNLNAALVGDMSPEEAMAANNKKIEGILEGAGYYG